MDILGTLGLGEVSGDPDDVPVGAYDAVIYQSEYVLAKNKDSLAHVITFKVVGGERDGAKPRQWNTLGSAPRNEAGEFPANVQEVATYTPTMSEKQKSYYKKTWVDSGIPEDQVGRLDPSALVGKPVTIRVYLSNGFKNVAVNGVRATDEVAGTPTEGGSVSPFPSF